MPQMNEIGLILGIHILAVMSPGPDFSLVMKSTLEAGKRAGILVALGISIGALFHCSYTFFGLNQILSQSTVILDIVKWLGAVYLFYLGSTALWAGFRGPRSVAPSSEDLAPSLEKAPPKKIEWKFFLTGCLANILNPKAALFFISVFSQLISPHAPNTIRLTCVFLIWSTTLLWFIFVAELIHRLSLHPKFVQAQNTVTTLMGAVLMALAVRLVLS